MLIYVTKLIHLPILDPESQRRLGEVVAPVFDADRGVLSALEVKKAGILPRTEYVTFGDVTSFERHAVLCDEGSLLPLAELPKIDTLLREHRPVINQRAVSAHRSLGKVEEVAFDVGGGHIIQIHVHHLFKRRIFTYRDIETVTRRAVMIRDDVARVFAEEEIPEVVPETA